jgi:hypothetical protein
MKKSTLFVLLIAVFVLAFSSAAFAAYPTAPTVWNFEKDFDNGGLLELTAVAIPSGVYGAPGHAGVTDPGPYTGQALDNRGRAGRIFISKNALQPYNFGAAGAAPIYTPTTVASTIQGYIGDAAWNTWLLTQSASNQIAFPDAIEAAGVWGAPYYKMNNGPAPTPDPHGDYVYLQWWAVDAENPGNLVDVTANTGSPHGGFTTTSIKCAVCHSVHTAAPAESAAAPVADTLLRGGRVWLLPRVQGQHSRQPDLGWRHTRAGRRQRPCAWQQLRRVPHQRPWWRRRDRGRLSRGQAPDSRDRLRHG